MSHTLPTVVILTAGENTRFFPFNTRTHKGGLTLMGEPLIVRHLRNLEQNGYKEVVIVVSEKDYSGNGISGVVQQYSFDLKISYVLQSQAKGMGDAVLKASEHIGDRFVVTFPHLFDTGEMSNHLQKHSGEHGAITVGVTDTPWLYGIVTVDGERVLHIEEKPAKGTEQSNLYAQGVYLLARDFLDVLREVPDEEYSFELALDKYLQTHQVQFYKQDAFLPSLKYPWQLFDFQHYLFTQMNSITDPSAIVAPTAIIDDSSGPVIIERGVKIGHAAKIAGPCYIGAHALIGDFSFVRGSSIEAGVMIGANTEVVRSIFFEHSEIHYAYIADSIVGHYVKIGGGLLTANKRHDRENIKVMVKGNRVDIGRNNLGVFIGANAKLGVRVTTMPGVMIGAQSMIYPSKTLFENVAENEVVK